MKARDRAPQTRRARAGRQPGFVFEAAALVALLALAGGCAVELDEIEQEPTPVEQSEPKIVLNEPPQSGGATCAPILNSKLELLGWWCAPKRLIEPGDDFGEGNGGGIPGGGHPIPMPDPPEPLTEPY